MNFKILFLAVSLCLSISGICQYTILYEDFQDPISFMENCDYSYPQNTNQWIAYYDLDNSVSPFNTTPAGYVGYDEYGDQLTELDPWPSNWWIGMDNIWNSGEVNPVDTNFVLAATSYLGNVEMVPYNVLVTPPVFVPSFDVDLKWKSAPYWFPYFSDGYQVYITTGATAPDYSLYQSLNPVWIQSESTGYFPGEPLFQPSNGYIHGDGGTLPEYFYDCPTPNIVKGALEPHEINLEQYEGQWIRIAFVHNSYDDFVLTLDDIEVIANSGDNSCIDYNQGDPFANCPSTYDPVCGCDGYTYNNACEAENYAGVQSWTEGVCAPTFIGVPEDLTEECGVDCDAFDYLEYQAPTVSAQINGNDIPVETFYDIAQLCEFEGGFEAQVAYTTNYEGIIYFEEYVYRCEDTQAPVWTSFPNDIEIACWDDGIPVPDYPTAFDICSGDNVEVFEVFGTQSPICPETFVTVYEWHAVDGCGNEAIDYSYVVSVDVDAPEISCPSTATVSNLSAADPSITGEATAFDFCDFDVEITYSDGPIISGNPSSFVRSWTAVDDCGNASSCDQSIIGPSSTFECFEVAHTIPVPGPQGQGLAYNNGSLWSASQSNIYQISPSDGSIISSILGEEGTYYGGMAFVGNQLWLTDRNLKQLRRIDTSTGATLQTIELSPDRFLGECLILGLAEEEGDLWFNARFEDNGVDSTYRISTSGVILEAYEAYGETPSGMAHDQTSLWFANNGTNSSIQRIDSDFNVIETYPVPGGNFPNGLAYDGECLWIQENSSNTIYKMNICPLTQPPYFESLSESYAQECNPDGVDPFALGILAIDPDGSTVSLFFELIDFFEVSCGSGLGTYIYSVLAIDQQEETALGTFEINYFDNTPPLLFVAPSVTIECGDDIPEPSASVEDECGFATWAVSESIESLCGNTEQITRFYTAFDDCGNAASGTQVITVVDTTPPIINAAASLSIECGDAIPEPDASVSDACGEVSWTVSELSESLCGETQEIFRTYTATDACGNTSFASQVITIEDTTPPTITVTAELSIECGNPVPEPAASVSDNCGDVTWTVFESNDGSCGAAGVIVRTYVATDACNNTNSTVQIIAIEDNTPPQIVCPPNVNVDDIENTNPSETGTASATDLCGLVTLSFVDGPITGVPASFVRTWIAIDECGNSSSCNQNISASECDPLNINALPNLTLECGADIPGGDFTVTGGCPPLEVETTENEVAGCGETFVLTRTYVVTDAAGNVASDTQVITIVDTTAPTISIASDVTIECGIAVPEPSASVSDNCGDASWTFFESFDSSCGGAGVIVRTYLASDACNNTNSATQIITIEDTTAPVLTCPPNITVENIQDAEPSLTGTATATDACGEVSISFIDGPISGVPGSFTRTWVALDACENLITCDQLINESACDPLSINASADVTLECGAEIPQGDYTAIGGCPPLNVEITENQEAGCGETFILTRVYTVTDAAGNIAIDTQVITVVDTTAPSINAAADVTLECGDDIPGATCTTTDTCGDATWFVNETIDNSCGDSGQIIRTYVAMDECGNTSTATQLISIVDSSLPVLTCPPNANVEDIEVADPSIAGLASATDLCGDVSIVFSDGPITGVPGSFTRTWTATDECGNSVSCEQFITEADCDPLSISTLPSITIECGEEIPASEYNVLGGCLPVEVVESEDVVEGCGETSVITRTYVATDAAGTISTATQVITVEDTTPPSVLADPDLSIECGDLVPEPNCTVSDTCGEADWTVTIGTQGLCGDTEQITRTYTASDACGNNALATQVITITDTTGPEIDCPADFIVEDLDNAPPSLTGNPTVSDDCGEVTVSFTDPAVPGPTSFIRTFTATDDCGNTSTCDQLIQLAVGLNENEFNVEFQAVPNPSNGQITLYLNDNFSENFTWTCFDIVGKAVKKGASQVLDGSSNIDLSELATGGYFLRVEFEEAQGIQKIQISR